MKTIRIDRITIGAGRPLALIAGPCVIEDERMTRRIAAFLKKLTNRLNIPFIFKASYDKANRTSLQGYRGPGAAQGLEILAGIRADYRLPVLSDVHRFEEIEAAAAVLDVVQIPAFLCRQTDFVMTVARKARTINVKKGQFLAPWDMKNVIEKVEAAGNENLLITERGTSFGYNNLVTDMRSLPILRNFGYPVIFDATHSVQLPGGMGTSSGGQREMIPFLARAAVAAGVDGIFFEVHPEPETARCDGPNSLHLAELEELLAALVKIDRLVKSSIRE
ncbi:MAG TPA: 3-deoxy-8-phosphooctulonate synthase [Syntrophales bacterium]|nr:3-deoxy-8-phosphooctulonate synthase [Syntrophales bacterium]HOD98580.1 3-deoxy-8-phosphooctulonate synthase [Syntrophales bacterium]HPN08903.1 3-deoxy-8-phosphooctulonate synthase [Syntrophales bacterium]HQK79751.1 3-deoxy-8-phosphooctulonate synthase [Syntrophales bacterium]